MKGWNGGCADPKLWFRLVGEFHDCFLLQSQNLRGTEKLYVFCGQHP